MMVVSMMMTMMVMDENKGIPQTISIEDIEKTPTMQQD